MKSVYLSTCGILFFGTPHLGSDLASDASLRTLVGIVSVFRDTDSQLLKHLRRDSEWLEMNLKQ